MDNATDGICDGRTEGEVLNVNVGCTEGNLLGSDDTVWLGTCVGLSLNFGVGTLLGEVEGIRLGSNDGNGLGSWVGLCDGLVEGSELGLSLNVTVGMLLVDGASVDAGLFVGACNYDDDEDDDEENDDDEQNFQMNVECSDDRILLHT